MNVLIAEDEPICLAMTAKHVRGWGYGVIEAADGHEAWRLVRDQAAELVICDWKMPHMDGLTLCRRIRQFGAGRYIYVIMVSGADGPGQIVTALEAGADDYLCKPLDFIQLHARLAIGKRVLGLQSELTGRIASLQRTHWQSIRMFAQMIEAMDPELGGHGRRTAALSLEIARRGAFAGTLPEKAMAILEAAALLHDIGLLLLPKNVWAKRRNERTGDEQHLFQQHPIAGAQILNELDILKPVARLVALHHEQHNGRGFPSGLEGRRLPLLARIVAAAAIYDNLIHRGGYGPAEAVHQLHRMRPAQLAPAMVDLLLDIHRDGLVREQSADLLDLPADQLREGMVLARDLARSSGAVLIPKGTQITRYTIEKIKNYNLLHTIGDTVGVYREERL